ncbi:endolytic transglycosylase MltG [Balneicella halophila]|nr:endolytic transglycosylase MltG [Balneicella halophila]
MKKLLLFLAILGFILIGIIGFAYYKINDSLFLQDYGLVVNKHTTPEDIFTELKNKDIINSKLLPTYLARAKQVNQFKEGFYYFPKGTSTNAFINTLRAGRQSPVKLTFNNTRTLFEFAGKISRQIKPDSLELLNHLTNDSVANSYGFDKNNFIGMFLPNTYEMYYTATPKEFTDRMNKEYLRFWNTQRKKKAEELGYTQKQISIVASIVDEETNKSDEKSRIAGVYLNRLERNIPLQADPTLKFAVGDFTIKRLLNKHMEVDSPYNTYKYSGLPPGPIRQPSISAIDAVLNAENHNYIYFCAKADFSGYHVFSKTLSEHNRNARAYHRALNKRGIR